MCHGSGGFSILKVMTEISPCRIETRTEIAWIEILVFLRRSSIPSVVIMGGGCGGQRCYSRVVYNVVVVMIVVVYNNVERVYYQVVGWLSGRARRARCVLCEFILLYLVFFGCVCTIVCYIYIPPPNVSHSTCSLFFGVCKQFLKINEQ